MPPVPERLRMRLNYSRGVGAPALFAIAVLSVGSSLYFVLGLVAKDALGLTPLAFLLAGGFFVVTTMTYIEASSLHPERGGSSTFARYAFNELWSFIAGWAILLDYLIVLAIGAFSISHYLSAFWGEAGGTGIEIAVAGAALAFVAVSNIRGLSGDRLGLLLRLGLVNMVLLALVIVLGLFEEFDPGAITGSIDLGSAPSVDDLLYAVVLASVALTGIEAASGLAGEIRVGRRGLKRVVFAGAITVLALFVGMSVVALMALPVEGATTPLGDRWVEAPVLGVVSEYDPGWLRDMLRYAVGAIGAFVLLEASNSNMLGISRLSYSLATNRQIPSLIGRLYRRRGTPYIAISIAALLAFALVIPADLDFMAGIFAFGAMLALTIAHVAVIVLRFREPDLPRAYFIPLNVKVRGVPVPVPAAVGAIGSGAGLVFTILFSEAARWTGLGWMAFGLALYVIYRRASGKPLARRFTIPATALEEATPVEYGSILVPVFGTGIDDDIVGTAGRLAAEESQAGEGGPMIEALYVLEMPLALPLDARVDDERVTVARNALSRAKEVGEEYEGVEVAGAMVRGRSIGATIVEEARRRGVEAIVLAAEPPTKVRGGARLGGRAGVRERSIDSVTEYVIEKAHCQVILTAAPAGEEGEREGVAP